ncbi:MAG: biotin synthase BioB [Planctomycetes bacterium]|nr:biotin synthase BioB [Planctomycetota bacterium]
MSMDWRAVAERSIAGVPPSIEEARAVLDAPHSEWLSVLDAAFRVRRHFHGLGVKIHVLLNAKSGLCPEDCQFCSQSSVAEGEVERYRLLSKERMVDAARRAKERKAWKFCIVTSTRGPSKRELDVICDAVREIKRDVGIRVCASLGLLEDAQARRLKEAGVDRFNHNLETAERRFAEICTTHTYQDRWETLQRVQRAGMEACSGGIIGMGESDEEIVELAFAARRSGATSIPVNFLDPRPGTPFAHLRPPEPVKCLKVLCLFRFVNPSRDIRIAGGREVNLRSLQPFALWPCNSIFTGGYLTTPGNEPNADHRMIRDAGFEIVES